MAKIIIRQGKSHAEDYALTQSDGTAYDLTDCTLRFTVKRSIEDLDADALLTYVGGDPALTITDADGGLAELRIPAADTLDLPTIVPLRWDVQVTAADGTVDTLQSGTVTVLPSVRRAAL